MSNVTGTENEVCAAFFTHAVTLWDCSQYSCACLEFLPLKLPTTTSEVLPSWRSGEVRNVTARMFVQRRWRRLHPRSRGCVRFITMYYAFCEMIWEFLVRERPQRTRSLSGGVWKSRQMNFSDIFISHKGLFALIQVFKGAGFVHVFKV